MTLVARTTNLPLPRKDNQPGRCFDIVAPQVVIAKYFFYLHTLVGKHIVEIAEGEFGNTFCIKMPGRLMILIRNLDLFIEMILILPLGNMKCHFIDRSCKRSFLVLPGVMYVEVIYHKQSTLAQTLGNGPDGIIVLSPGSEITKAGKKIKCVLEIVDPKKITHIVLVKMQVCCFLQPGF